MNAPHSPGREESPFGYTIPLCSFFRRHDRRDAERSDRSQLAIGEACSAESMLEEIADGRRPDPSKAVNWGSPPRSIQIAVELPFWMLIGENEFQFEYKEADFRLRVSQSAREMLSGAHVLRSGQNSLGLLLPSDDHSPRMRLYPAEAAGGTCWRQLRTVLMIESLVPSDALEALSLPSNLEMGDPDLARRNAADMYFRSLAFNHFGPLNEFIRSYRVASNDYFAHQISEWDTPRWFIYSEDGYGCIGLFPYRLMEDYPSVASFSEGPTTTGLTLVDPDTVRQAIESQEIP
ncbi:MAG: hypothetical protein AAF907_04400, partial [Planctomycetota bacterium]